MERALAKEIYVKTQKNGSSATTTWQIYTIINMNRKLYFDEIMFPFG